MIATDGNILTCLVFPSSHYVFSLYFLIRSSLFRNFVFMVKNKYRTMGNFLLFLIKKKTYLSAVKLEFAQTVLKSDLLDVKGTANSILRF